MTSSTTGDIYIVHSLTNGNSIKRTSSIMRTLTLYICHWHFQLFQKLGQVKVKLPVINFPLIMKFDF